MKYCAIRKMLVLTIVLLNLSTISSALWARSEGFGYELSGTFSSTEDDSGLYEISQTDIEIAIFEKEVGYGDYPFLLTNFFERRAHLDFSYRYIDSESGSDDSSADVYKVNYVFTSDHWPALFNIGASRLVGEGDDIIGQYDIDATTFYFGFGYYVSPNSIINLSLSTADYRLSDDVNPDVEFDENHLEVFWQHVRKMGPENYMALVFSAEAVEVGSSNNSNVGGFFDYYVNRRTGLGIGYTAHRGDYGVTEGGTITLRASLFLNTRIGFVAEVSRLSADEPDSDEDSYKLKAMARF